MGMEVSEQAAALVERIALLPTALLVVVAKVVSLFTGN